MWNFERDSIIISERFGNSLVIIRISIFRKLETDITCLYMLFILLHQIRYETKSKFPSKFADREIIFSSSSPISWNYSFKFRSHQSHSTLDDLLYFYYADHLCLHFLVGINTLGQESVIAAGTFSLRFSSDLLWVAYLSSYFKSTHRLFLFLFIFPFPTRATADEGNAVGRW